MKTYNIHVIGCGAPTTITVELTPAELALLSLVAEQITAQSDTSCEPRMYIGPHILESRPEDHQ